MEKFKKMIKERRELFIFVGALLFLFGTVFTVASVTSNRTVENPIVEEPRPLPRPIPNDDKQTGAEIEKMMLPIDEDYLVARNYYEYSDTETQHDSMQENGVYYRESNGISYVSKDNKVFEVKAIFSGEVTELVDDGLKNYKIVIKHNDHTTSIYNCVTTPKVKVGDKVDQGQVIGNSGLSLKDTKIGSHVHLEILIDNTYVNPTAYIGTSLDNFTLSNK